MVVEFTGYLVDANDRRPVRICISGPHYNASGSDYFFELTAPEILGRVERIFGVDENQSGELAARYLLARLNGRSLLSQDGNPTDVLDLFGSG